MNEYSLAKVQLSIIKYGLAMALKVVLLILFLRMKILQRQVIIKRV